MCYSNNSFILCGSTILVFAIAAACVTSHGIAKGLNAGYPYVLIQVATPCFASVSVEMLMHVLVSVSRYKYDIPSMSSY
jgi:hypothetical protein